jgi:hypothetical protein
LSKNNPLKNYRNLSLFGAFVSLFLGLAGMTLLISQTATALPVGSTGTLANAVPTDLPTPTTPDEPSLSYGAGSNGHVVAKPVQSGNNGFDQIEVTAVADPGYHFDQWSDGNRNPSRVDETVTAKMHFDAFFVEDSSTTPTPSPTASDSPTPTPTPSPSASFSPTPAATESPTETPSATPIPAPSPGAATIVVAIPTVADKESIENNQLTISLSNLKPGQRIRVSIIG